MKVVLLDNIRGVGQVGDVKEVSDGYARNFLFPRRAAKPVTEGILKEVATLKTKKLQELAAAKEVAQELAKKLDGTRIELAGKANEQGTLFAAIERDDIATEASKAAGVKVPADAVKLSEHIKSVGEHPVDIELTEDVTAHVVVVVTAQ